MVAPGLFERIISPAILRARTSRILGDTDMQMLLEFAELPLKETVKYKTIPIFVKVVSEKERRG
jgi:hypothetical protein